MAAGELPTLGVLLKRHRTALGLTQEALAERAGLSARTISNIERGRESARQRRTVLRLAIALALPAHDHAALEAAVLRREGGLPLLVSADPAHHAGGGTLPPLVGRAHELRLLERHLAGEGPPVLLLSGEPGIGKSRLLDEAVARNAGRGWTVLRGGCQRRGGDDAFAPLSPALWQYIQAQDPARRRVELQGCAWLARLLPELAPEAGEALPAQPLSPDQERAMIVQAVARFLNNVTGPAGALLVLDDLQWASADALELLAALLREASPGLLRVLGAYRDTEVRPGDPLSIMLDDPPHRATIARLALPQLSADDARRLFDELTGDLDGVDPLLRGHALYQSGGVPLFMVNCAHALLQGGEAAAHRVIAAADVVQSFQQRLAGVTGTARTVLRVASVVGRWAPRDLLLALSLAPEADVLAALDATDRLHLLVKDTFSDAYYFSHDIVREVVEREIPPAEQAALHRRIAVALEVGLGEPTVELLAYHYAHSDDQEKAISYLERAGDHARDVTAHASAAGYYRDLAGRLDRLGRRADAAAARIKLSMVLRWAAHYDEALDALEQAALTYRELGDLDGLGQVIAWIGQTHVDRGTIAEGLGRIQGLLGVLEERGASQGLAALYARLTLALFVSGQYDAQLATATRGAELARTVGDDVSLANAESARGGALMMLGCLSDALPVLMAAVPLAEAAGDFECLASVLTNVATIHMYRGEFDQARDYTERAITVVERLNHPAHVVLLRLRRAFIALFTGEWARARETIEWAIGLEAQMGGSWGLAYPLLSLGALCLLEGKWSEGEQHLERALVIARRGGDMEALRWVQSRLAERDLLHRQPRVALARLSPLLDRPGLEELDVTMLLPRLAWAYLELGDHVRAGEVAQQGVERARRQEHRIALADALWVQGMVAARRRQWSEARSALDEGLALARRMPYRYAEARMLWTYGLMHKRKGEPALARERLVEALAVFRLLGARKDAARVKYDLKALHG